MNQRRSCSKARCARQDVLRTCPFKLQKEEAEDSISPEVSGELEYIDTTLNSHITVIYRPVLPFRYLEALLL